MARGAKGQRGLRQLSDGKDTHIFFVSSGLSTRRGIAASKGYRGLSTYAGGCRILRELSLGKLPL